MLSRVVLPWLGWSSVIWIGAISIAVLGAGSAEASSVHVVTFTGLPAATTSEWHEDGVTVRGVAIGSADTPDVAHVDSCCSDFASLLDFTTGSRFRPISLKLDPIQSGFCEDPLDPSCSQDDPMPYIRISGFADGVAVAWTTFYVPASTPMMTLSLVDVLGPIEVDVLGIQAIPSGPGVSRFEIDDVTLETVPVPEPSTSALLLPALAALALRRRRSSVREAL